MSVEQKLRTIANQIIEDFLQREDKDGTRWPTLHPLQEQLYVMLDGAVGDFEILAKNGPAETISERWLDRP